MFRRNVMTTTIKTITGSPQEGTPSNHPEKLEVAIGNIIGKNCKREVEDGDVVYTIRDVHGLIYELIEYMSKSGK